MAGHDTNDNNKTAGQRPDAAGPSLVLDIEKYKPYLDDPALSEAEKREFLETVWAMLLQAMVLGIRIEIDAETFCGQLEETPLPTPIEGEDRVESRDDLFQSEFKDVAQPNEAVAAEGSR